MSAALRSLRFAAITMTLLVALSPLASTAVAGEEGPPVPDPGPHCVVGVGFETLLDAILDVGSGLISVAL